MALSSELVGVVAGALSVLTVTIFAFGYRFSDKSGKFDEKSQSDELNAIRVGMREGPVIEAIDRMWQFLKETNDKLKDAELKKGSKSITDLKAPMRVVDLLYDINRRELFNRVINELEQSFQDSAKVKEAWLALKTGYGQLGKSFYVFGVVFAVTSYPLLCLSSQTLAFLSSDQLLLSWSVVAILGILFLVPIVYTHRKIASNMSVYQAKRRQYLIDNVKVGT